MITPFDFIERLRAWFFAKDRDITLQSGRKIVVTGANVEITTGGIVITGGNITVDGTVDGVDISAHAADSDAHHDESHTLASHTGTLDHDDLSNVTADQHHNESHTVASHSDTSATGSELNTLTDGSDASSLHDHDGRYYQESEFSSNPGSNSAPLESDTDGRLELDGFAVGMSPTANDISASADIAAFGNLLSSNDIRVGGGLVLGSTSTNPATGEILLPTISSPGTPSSGYGSLYVNTSNNLIYRDKDGNAWICNTTP